MRVRIAHWLWVGAGFAMGAALPRTAFEGETGQLLSIFLGLLAASVLPTISLLIDGMTVGGRSVKALNDLRREIQAAIDALLFLFGLAVVTVILLLLASVPIPQFSLVLPKIEATVDGPATFRRIVHGLAMGASFLLIARAGQIPALLRRTLEVRHELALDEARRRLKEAAPQERDVRADFATHGDFGKTVPFSDLSG